MMPFAAEMSHSIVINITGLGHVTRTDFWALLELIPGHMVE
jgi:hypothetical protein